MVQEIKLDIPGSSQVLDSFIEDLSQRLTRTAGHRVRDIGRELLDSEQRIASLLIPGGRKLRNGVVVSTLDIGQHLLSTLFPVIEGYYTDSGRSLSLFSELSVRNFEYLRDRAQGHLASVTCGPFLLSNGSYELRAITDMDTGVVYHGKGYMFSS